MKTYYWVHFFLLCCFAFTGSRVFSQSLTQTIQGVVIDKDTRQPLIGATVQVAESSPVLGTVTDENGAFTLEKVPVGRQIIECGYLGYQTFRSDAVILNAAKALTMSIELIEAAEQLQEVVVTAYTRSNDPINELAVVSARSFSVEETQRYAASVNDPGRLAMSFPGVQPSRDRRSDIIVRGNSSIGLLWRLEGIDIPNPNHFARRGTSGGGITIFSISMLSNSDFLTGAFPAEYGNATAGVFDVKFRKGNREKAEYTFRAGLLGLDFSTEGPFKKGRSSYLVNYRYSTLGILNDLGFPLVGKRFDNTFQDLSFNLNFPSADNRTTLSWWGMGGLSNEIQNPLDPAEERSNFDEFSSYEFRTNMGATGLSLTHLLDDKSYLKATLALMAQDIYWRDDTVGASDNRFTYNKEDYLDQRLSLSLFYSRKFSAKTTLKAGLIANQISYDLFQDSVNLVNGRQRRILDVDESAQLLQPFAQIRWRPHPQFTLNAGFHTLYLTLNQTGAIDPRLGMRYEISDRQWISFGYGLHSRHLPLGTYFTQVNGALPNLDLPMMRAHHLVLAFESMIKEKLRLHAEVYYQHLFQLPVGAEQGTTYTIINDIQGFANRALDSRGIGRNAGLDISLERAFDQGAFFLISGSVFTSKYRTGEDGPWYNTQYNSGYMATFAGGKEWKSGRSGTLQLGLRLLLNGGMPITPLSTGINGRAAYYFPPLDYSRPFADKTAVYFRPDLRIAYRKDKPKSAWQLALDIQNVMNRLNVDALDYEYDTDTKSWINLKQTGLTPVISFQVDW